MRPALKAWRDNEYIKKNIYGIRSCADHEARWYARKRERKGNKKKALFPIGETYEISVTPLAGLALADAEPEDEGEEVLGTGVRKEAS